MSLTITYTYKSFLVPGGNNSIGNFFMEVILEDKNYDPYAELNTIISKEDEADLSSGKKTRKNREAPRREKPKKEKRKQEEKKNGSIGRKVVITIFILLCCVIGSCLYFKPKFVTKGMESIESFLNQGKDQKKESKTESKPKKSTTKSSKKNVSDSDTQAKTQKKETDDKNVSDSDTKSDSASTEVSHQTVVNDGFSYADGAIKVGLCGNTFDFPFAPNAVADKGWNGISVNADPDNASLIVSTWTNVDGSTLYLYYPNNQDGATVTKAECSFVGTASSFLGLSTSKAVADCDSLFADAEKKYTDGLDASGNGTEIFYYKTCQIDVSFQNGFVTSCSITKI